MPRVKVAHISEQGQDMIIVPLAPSFGLKNRSEQNAVRAELQARASAAGLRGTVALVWRGGFLAPQPWHRFFRTFPLEAAHRNLNRELCW